MVKNYIMIKQLLKNETFVKKLEQIAEELNTIKDAKGNFDFLLPKLLINIEGLMKIYHKDGSNTFDYVTKHTDTFDEKEKINFLKLIQQILLLKSNKY